MGPTTWVVRWVCGPGATPSSRPITFTVAPDVGPISGSSPRHAPLERPAIVSPTVRTRFGRRRFGPEERRRRTPSPARPTHDALSPIKKERERERLVNIARSRNRGQNGRVWIRGSDPREVLVRRRAGRIAEAPVRPPARPLARTIPVGEIRAGWSDRRLQYISGVPRDR